MKINSTTLLWRFSLFQNFNCMNNALVNIMVHILLWNYIMFFFLWNSFLGMRLVDPTVCEFLFSEDIAILQLTFNLQSMTVPFPLHPYLLTLSFYYAFIKYMIIKGKCIVTLICISWLLIILSAHTFMAIIPTFG